MADQRKDRAIIGRKPVEIPDRVFFRIGDVSEIVGVKPYVLRYWESEFPILSPGKSSTGQRVYKRSDVETLLMIKHLLYQERYSIEGARKRIRELRRDGSLALYKKEKILGGAAHLERKKRRALMSQKINELETLLKKPLHELFRV